LEVERKQEVGRVIFGKMGGLGIYLEMRRLLSVFMEGII